MRDFHRCLLLCLLNMLKVTLLEVGHAGSLRYYGAAWQVATIHSVIAIGMVQFGTQLTLSSQPWPSGLAFTTAAVFGILVARAFWRVKRLDKFEREIKG